MTKIYVTILIVLLQLIFMPVSKIFAVTPPDRGLGAADSYGVFAKAGVTNTGAPTHIWGNVGADSSVIGLTASQVDGSIITDGDTAGVATDASSTYDSLMSATQGAASGLDLAGTNTINPGVYTVGATTLNGTLTLDGDGVYIFRSSSSNTTPHSGTMNMINGATACNVFWAIADSMSIGTGATMIGTIIAQTGSITIDTGATLEGRAISLIASVTLDSNQITEPVCSTATPTPTAIASSVSSNTTVGGGAAPFCETINSQVIDPSVIESRRVSPTSIFLSWAPYSGLDTFNVEYGTSDGNWLYNTDVKGFSTTLNNLPENQPIWVRVAARSVCTIGDYGPSKLIGGPGLPNTGIKTNQTVIPWYIPAGVLGVILILYKFSFRHER